MAGGDQLSRRPSDRVTAGSGSLLSIAVQVIMISQPNSTTSSTHVDHRSAYEMHGAMRLAHGLPAGGTPPDG